MTIYENGNETDAAWGGNKYCNPVSYFAQSTADYDGHEGRMGKTYGIKNADTNSNLMLAGFTSFDVDRLRVLQFLCKTMRKDKNSSGTEASNITTIPVMEKEIILPMFSPAPPPASRRKKIRFVRKW